MNIYLVERKDCTDYDQYDSFVIIAENAEIAKNTNPEGKLYNINENKDNYYDRWERTWCRNPNETKITLLGIADKNIKSGIIHKSFRAG